jgi:hypothetical protein
MAEGQNSGMASASIANFATFDGTLYARKYRSINFISTPRKLSDVKFTAQYLAAGYISPLDI